MLWALLFSLIFSGGEESILLNPQVKKHLRQTVSDKERKEMALDFAKIYLEEADDFSKRQKKRITVFI